MPNTRTAHAVRLEFTPDSLVQSYLSGAAFTGNWLWVAGDEACGLDRRSLLDPVGREALRFGAERDFPLADLLDFPGTAGEAGVVGSHGLKRKNAKPDCGHADDAKGLAKVVLNGDNREPVRFEAALTESVPLPHGRGSNLAEAICDLLRHE